MGAAISVLLALIVRCILRISGADELTKGLLLWVDKTTPKSHTSHKKAQNCKISLRNHQCTELQKRSEGDSRYSLKALIEKHIPIFSLLIFFVFVLFLKILTFTKLLDFVRKIF